MIELWRSRWAAMSRVTRYGFWLTLVAAVLGLMTTGLSVAMDYSPAWSHVSDLAIAIMFVGMGIQLGGHWRDRRERQRPYD